MSAIAGRWAMRARTAGSAAAVHRFLTTGAATAAFASALPTLVGAPPLASRLTWADDSRLVA